VTQVILDGRVVEVRGATPEAVLEQIAELVPAGMRGKTGAAAKVGIASAADMKAAMAPRGFRLLAAPQIATVDGQAATLRTGEERYLPVGWTQRDEKGEVRKGPDGSPLATPVFGEPTHIGCVVEYTPHLAADGKSLDLEVASRIVEFVEYEDVKMADAHDPTTELTGKMAVLRTRSAVGRLTVPIGSSVCLVSNLVIEEQKKEKRVPVLGSVPFVGKAFRRSKTVPIVTGYVFFVSPTVHRAKARVPAADQKPKESE
jgi:type II secretory pathway component GspD/PulD (secretin)